MNPGDSVRVLHVDDDAPFVETAATLLEQASERFQVQTATAVQEAVTILEDDAVDCIVSDYDMREENGLDFLDKVRERDPELPFILFTGKGSEEIASEAISRGVTDYLQKEGNRDQFTILANRIEHAVDRYRSQQELTESRERLSLLLDQSPLGVIEWDREVTVQRMNEKAAEILGYDQEKLVGGSWRLLVPESEYEEVGRMAEELQESSEQRSRITETIRSDGSSILCEWHNRTVTDDDGNIVAILSQFQDVTDRRDNQRRLETLIDTLPGIVYQSLNEPEWPLELVRGPCEEVTGYTAAELESKVQTIEKLIHPDDRPFVRSAFDDPEEITEPFDLIYRITRKDGQTRWVWERGKPVELPGGKQVLEGLFIDVTELKEQELALDETTTLLSTLVADLPIGALIEDSEQSVLAANTELEKLFDFRQEQGGLIGADTRELRERIATQVVEPESFTAQLKRVARSRDVVAGEQFELTDGRIIEWTHAPYSLPSGEATLWLFRDITDREQREQQLEEHRKNLEQLHDAANRLYVADSIEECYEITIDAAVTILGFDWCTLTAPAENGEEFEIIAVSEDAPVEVGDRPFGLDEGIAGQVYQTKEPSVVNNAVEEERGKPVTETIRSGLTIPVGEWGVFQAVAETTDVFDEQDRKHTELLVSSMITAVERLEQQSEIRARQAALKRQNERLDQFASVVSHDLRNPLNVATGRLALARDECNSEHLDHIEKAHDRMETLIDDLLTLAREGERVDDPDIVKLSEVTRRCWAHVATNDATLRADADQPIEADRGRLEQLLENLVRNAVEHASTNDQYQDEDVDETDEEGITVRVGSLEDGFFIEDDGPGIPEGERDQIFDLGYSTAEGGTGFGLSIVEQVVDAHDWSIAVTEGTDGGARFEITGVETVDEPTQ